MFISDLVGLVISLALFAAFSAGIFWYTHEKNLDFWLNNFGNIAKAKIIDKQIRSGSRSSQWAYIHYRFTVVGNPAAFYREQQVSHQHFSQLSIGDTVTICYYPANPVISRLDGEFADRSAYRSARLVGCFCMILGYFLVYPTLLFGERLYQEYKAKRLLNDSGRNIQGNIVGHKHQSSRIFCLVYQYTVKNNTITVTQQVSRRIYSKVNDGNSVQLRYLPTNPTTARLIDKYIDYFAYIQLIVYTLLSIMMPILFVVFYVWLVTK